MKLLPFGGLILLFEVLPTFPQSAIEEKVALVDFVAPLLEELHQLDVHRVIQKGLGEAQFVEPCQHGKLDLVELLSVEACLLFQLGADQFLHLLGIRCLDLATPID
eukprot:scaffold48_cov311-Pinguiococcus_pyrenoidosus.AAC.159